MNAQTSNWKLNQSSALFVGIQELEKRKIIDETIKTAAAKAAPIEEFPSFLKYGRNGEWRDNCASATHAARSSGRSFSFCSLHVKGNSRFDVWPSTLLR